MVFKCLPGNKSLCMQLSLFLLLLMLFLAFGFLIRFLLIRKTFPIKLFIDALQNENSGHFEAAIINYESALSAVKKRKVYSSLKNKIIEKIKVLHTIIEYKNSLHFIR